MSFFDSTPVGRIINIFSRDLDESICLIRIFKKFFVAFTITLKLLVLCIADNRIPTSAEIVLQNILIIIVSIVFVVMAIPWFLIALVILAAIFLMYSRIFRRGLRDLTRMEHVSRSPIYSHVDATINGLGTVHAFGKQRYFISK